MSCFEPLSTDAEEYLEALGNLDLETAERLDRPGE